jgi:hypothetical protein
MRLRALTAIFLFLSSYAPLGVIVIALDFDPATRGFANPLTVKVVALLAVLSAALPFVILRRLRGGVVYQATQLTNKNGDLVNYALPYLVTFVGLKLGEPETVVGFVLFMLLFGALTIKLQALWINPLLALTGFNLYEATLQKNGSELSTILVLSKRQLEVGHRFRADYLTPTQLYVTEFLSDASEKTRFSIDIRPDQED